jgi:hypothetical protein
MPNFKVKRETPLSPEHARQWERFTGLPYDVEADARAKEWQAFNLYHLEQKRAAAKLRRRSGRAK